MKISLREEFSPLPPAIREEEKTTPPVKTRYTPEGVFVTSPDGKMTFTPPIGHEQMANRERALKRGEKAKSVSFYTEEAKKRPWRDILFPESTRKEFPKRIIPEGATHTFKYFEGSTNYFVRLLSEDRPLPCFWINNKWMAQSGPNFSTDPRYLPL